ncbi:hypothetical protein [Pedobacter xixiisoli]|uniref:Uncharacterized protein n=1 Tax=Pedobacter xixiisoli TaxID=1476464 RepID=A0A285ZXK7_9SPHI|nr:hypothetical protein [Pedobacter xixiisoli]SOD14376.1 hypothetical protein SAMN06297358_1543 [Pedobacter xixiisoli]
MKKTTLLLFILTALISQSFAQIGKEISKENQVLFNVKSLLEKHFSGTNIRGLQKSFEIKSSHSDGYSFTSDVNSLFSEKSNKSLSIKLNKVLKIKDNTKLTGVLYFDDRLDSAMVDIAYKTEDTVYSFISMHGYAVPRGGFKAFSKRLHDFINEQITQGKLLKDSISSITSINIMVDKSGSFKQAKQTYLSKVIDVFLASEPRWNPSMSSGKHVPTVVSFSIIRDYINGGNWPREDNVAKKRYGYNDFDSYVNIYEIAFFYNNDVPVFYSNELLEHSGKTIISAVYDKMLKAYRMIAVHNGNLTNTNQLKNLTRTEASKEFYVSGYGYYRIYFMLD